MNRPRLVLRGGKPDYINIVGCLLIASYNYTDVYLKNESIPFFLLYVGFFLIFPVISIFWRDKTSSFILYACIGFLTLLFDQESSGVSGLLYVFFGYNEIKEDGAFYFLAGLSMFALSLRIILLQSYGSYAVVPIILFTFIFTTFYFKVVKQPKQIKNIDLLKEEEKAISKLYCAGYSYENISKTLSLNILPSTVRRRIKEIKDLNGINNDAQFGKWLHDLV